MKLEEELAEFFSTDFLKALKMNTEFARIFPNKEQRETLLFIIDKILQDADFHEYDDENPHNETIGKSIRDLEAKFRNHRHETGKTFSAKPEY